MVFAIQLFIHNGCARDCSGPPWGLRAQRAMSGQRNHEKPVCGFNLAPKKEKKEDICGSPLTRNFFMGGLNVGYSKW